MGISPGQFEFFDTGYSRYREEPLDSASHSFYSVEIDSQVSYLLFLT